MSSKKTGRPFTEGITEALLRAAERVMGEEGYSALTIDGLAADVGTTRPTFYRRFPSVAHLALEVIRNRFGPGSLVETGSLYEDLLAVQREEIAMFAAPVLQNSLPGLLEAARNNVELHAFYETDFIRPRRNNIARILQAAIDRQEIPATKVDVEYACDLLLGPILSRALLPVGAPLDDQLARQTAETVTIMLGAKVPAAT